MLSPVWYLIFLLLMIRCYVASSDLGFQIGEPFPGFYAEQNNLVDASESADRTDTTEFLEAGLIQSVDQCGDNSNPESRKMRSKRQEACSSRRRPSRDNGRSETEAPSNSPQIVPVAGDNPASKSAQQPNEDANLCPLSAPYPVCADPLVFPIVPDTLFLTISLG